MHFGSPMHRLTFLYLSKYTLISKIQEVRLDLKLPKPNCFKD